MKNIFSFLLIEPEDSKGLDTLLKRNLIFFGLLGSSIIALCIVLALRFSPAIYLIIPALCIPFIMVFWFRWYLLTFIKRMDRDKFVTRLSQKKIKYLESIIQDSDDIIFTLDNDSLILKFNKGAESHLGYSQEEIVGKPLSHLFVKEKEINSIISKTREIKNAISDEVLIKTKYGDIRHLNLSISEMNYGRSSHLNGFVVTAKDITEKKKLERELRRKNDQLNKLAITDSLTKLYNARYFYEQIKRELKRFKRTPDKKLSLIFLDIDHFKELNDTEGHQMGDHVLNSLGLIIKVCIREDIDSGYRYGGDEFVIILPDTGKEQANVVAIRIQKQYSAFKFGITSLSIGITEAELNDSEESIVKRADNAMYSSKRSGRALISIQ